MQRLAALSLAAFDGRHDNGLLLRQTEALLSVSLFARGIDATAGMLRYAVHSSPPGGQL